MTAQATRSASEMRTIELEIQDLTPESFAPYGEVSRSTAELRFDFDGGEVAACHVKLEPRQFEVNFLSRHLRTTQTYIPLGSAHSILVVAPPSVEEEDTRALPDLSKVAAFRLDGSVAVTIARAAWHRAPMPVSGEAHFVVVDREGTLEDLDLVDVCLNLGALLKIK